MTQEDRSRQQSKLLLKRMIDSRNLFVNHKPSIGYSGEHTLRQTIRHILPKTYGICQGFVMNNEKISRQCVSFPTSLKKSVNTPFLDVRLAV